MAPSFPTSEPWPALPGWDAPRLPRRLGRVLDERRALLPDRPDVLVLDLREQLASAPPPPPAGSPLPPGSPVSPGSSVSPASFPPAGGWPAIVTVLALASRPDLVGALRQLDAALAEGGSLWLLEPTSEPGMVATLATTLWPRTPAQRGLHLGRDLPAALRAAGFVLTDIERFTMPTIHPPLRPFVALRARRADRGADQSGPA